MALNSRLKAGLLIASPILIIGLCIYTYHGLQQGVVAAYYEWGVTCIIVSYAEEHGGEPPANWDDLAGYEFHSPYLPDPRDFRLAAQFIEVDFAALRDFQQGKTAELPDDVIRPIRGFEMHWIGPRYVLEGYFRDGIRPHGSFTTEEAEQMRENYEAEAEWDRQQRMLG